MSSDIFILATKALKNGKIRQSIAINFQRGNQMWTWFVNILHFLHKKAKIIFKNWTSV